VNESRASPQREPPIAVDAATTGAERDGQTIRVERDGETIRVERDGETIRLSGALTIPDVTKVLAAVDEVWPAEGFAGELVIDLGRVGLLDSAAVSLMLSWYRRARDHGFRLRFASVPRSLRQVATLYGVDDMLCEGGRCS
jgi:phospholipid transport system transporter-binding protein